jgi:phospholipase/carboxylesterase
MADLVHIDEFTLRVQIPDTPGPHPLILMLHGLTGTEDVMWIFASRLPQNAILVAPRGIYPAPDGGYTWQVKQEGVPHSVEGFQPAMEALWGLLTPETFPDARLDRIGIVGFSLGAALAYSMALSYPERTGPVAGMAGFMPQGARQLAVRQPLVGRTVFMAHGTRDETVPYVRAQEAKEVFETAGAQVTLCSDDVGHKLSAACFRALQEYFSASCGTIARRL